MNYETYGKKEREKMLQLLPIFAKNFTNVQFWFSDEKTFERYDLKMKYIHKDEVKRAVIEIKVRDVYYPSGYMIEKQKVESLLEFDEKIKLYFICFGPTGTFVYDLRKFNFDEMTTQSRLCPKSTSEPWKGKVYKDVYILNDHYKVYEKI